MTNWVTASSWTTTYVRVASAAWAVGVLAGSFSARPFDALSLVSGLCFLALGVVSVAIVVWTAWSHVRQPVARTGWLVLGAGLLIARAGNPGWSALVPWFSWSRLGGLDALVTTGYVVSGVGMVVLAASVGRVNDRGRSALWALGIASGVFVIMAAALLAPGPGVPYSAGALDVRATWRLLIDSGLMLLPMAYAVLAQLRSPEGHRARVWLWIAAASLVFAMGDVGAALLDHAGTQLYPRALWELGTVFIAAAAALTADFDREAHALPEGGSDEPATPAQELLQRMKFTA